MTLRLTLLAAAALAAVSCGNKTQPVSAAPAPAAKDPYVITATPELEQTLRVGPANWMPVSEKLTIPGRIEADERRIARVSAMMPGRVTGLEVIEGQSVERGQTVAVLYSTELSAAQLALLKALTQNQLAQRSVTRARQLLDAGVIGSAEFQRREAELAESVAMISQSRDQLQVLGMAAASVADLERDRRIHSTTPVVSPIAGIVTKRHVTPGQVVENASVLIEVADLSHVWLVADVPEEHAGAIEVGKFIEAEIPALPGEKLRGRLTHVSAVVDPDTRTVRVRADLLNSRRRFKPAMLAVVTLNDEAQRRQVVPASAVVREGNDDYVFVRSGERQYRMVPVKLGTELDHHRVIDPPLAAKESVVLDGAFHLNSERKRLLVKGS